MTYKNRNRALKLIILGLFCLLFSRGLELHLGKSITDRIRFHAIPVALAVLYHHHPHDYTGLVALTMQFQGPTDDVQNLINVAKQQNIGSDTKTYFWVADDKGFADFIIAAFALFGPHLMSMYFMWFLILLASSVLYLVSYGRKNWALGFLCFIYLGLYLAISVLPLVSANLINGRLVNDVSIYETRYLDVLAILPVFHMLLLACSRRPLNLLKDGLPFIGQLFIFLMLYHARSSLGWEILAVFMFCSSLIFIRVYSAYRQRKNLKLKVITKASSAFFVVVMLIAGILSLNIYKHVVYHPAYFSEMGARTFWHNALMGLGQYNTQLAAKYHVDVSDLNVAQAVISYARQSKKCAPDIEQLEGQQLLNTLGGYGIANWSHYEQCARQYYFYILSENKSQVLYMYAISKPLGALGYFSQAMTNAEITELEKVYAKLSVGWHPFNAICLTVLLLVNLLVMKSLYRNSRKLISIVITLLICSFIPCVAFYNEYLVLGGAYVIGGILIYLISVIIMQKIIQYRRSTQKIIEKSHYPSEEKKLSIIIPAYNEELRIATTMQQVYNAAQKVLDDFEILVINDGSTDKTHGSAVAVAEKLGKKVSIISQQINQGVGAAFHLGLGKAQFQQLCLIPGDNAYHATGIEALFSACGTAPLVISYRQNMEARTPLRHLLSRIATLSLRLITGMKIRDAHSLYLFPVAATRELGVKAAGYGYHIEILSRLLTRFKSVKEIPVTLNPKPDASSGVMKPKTLFILGATISRLLGKRIVGSL